MINTLFTTLLVKVKKVFPQENLKEIVYKECLPYCSLADPNLVCQLRKSLYELKQVLKTWFKKF